MISGRDGTAQYREHKGAIHAGRRLSVRGGGMAVAQYDGEPVDESGRVEAKQACHHDIGVEARGVRATIIGDYIETGDLRRQIEGLLL